MKALITGVTGFIGSYLAEYLLAKGMNVYGTFHRESSEDIAHLKDKITLSKCDVRDQATVQKIVKKSNPDFIFFIGKWDFNCIAGW